MSHHGGEDADGGDGGLTDGDPRDEGRDVQMVRVTGMKMGSVMTMLSVMTTLTS